MPKPHTFEASKSDQHQFVGSELRMLVRDAQNARRIVAETAAERDQLAAYAGELLSVTEAFRKWLDEPSRGYLLLNIAEGRLRAALALTPPAALQQREERDAAIESAKQIIGGAIDDLKAAFSDLEPASPAKQEEEHDG